MLDRCLFLDENIIKYALLNENMKQRNLFNLKAVRMLLSGPLNGRKFFVKLKLGVIKLGVNEKNECMINC